MWAQDIYLGLHQISVLKYPDKSEGIKKFCVGRNILLP